MKKTTIPGNKFSEFGRIYGDTTLSALETHLTRVVRNQAANQRHNVRYANEVTRLRRAIAAR